MKKKRFSQIKKIQKIFIKRNYSHRLKEFKRVFMKKKKFSQIKKFS